MFRLKIISNLLSIFSLFILVGLINPSEVKAAHGMPVYDRSDYFTGWKDADGDCINTRNEVLAEESLTPVMWDAKGCVVTSGLWVDPYTGEIHKSPSTLDIDHMIPLKEAHMSGGWDWNIEKKREYAQELANPNHLIAVGSSGNRSKGSRDPALWIPPNLAFLDEYLAAWIEIKEKWGLEMDDAEEAAIKKLLSVSDSFRYKLKFRKSSDVQDLLDTQK